MSIYSRQHKMNYANEEIHIIDLVLKRGYSVFSKFNKKGIPLWDQLMYLQHKKIISKESILEYTNSMLSIHSYNRNSCETVEDSAFSHFDSTPQGYKCERCSHIELLQYVYKIVDTTRFPTQDSFNQTYDNMKYMEYLMKKK